MNYSLIGLNKRSLVDVLEAVRLMPIEITSVDLSNNELASRAKGEAPRILESISAGVVTLDLSRNGLGSLRSAALLALMTAIPHTVEELCWRYNGLDTMSATVVTVFITNVRAKALDLSNNNFGGVRFTKLQKLLQDLPRHVATLTLKNNNLSQLGKHLHEVFSAIPQEVTTLTLSNNGFGHNAIQDIIKAIKAIPSGVSVLHLADNLLYFKSGHELTQLFAAIPSTVTHLDVSGNCLEEKSKADQIRFLGVIPPTVLRIAYFDATFLSRAEILVKLEQEPSRKSVGGAASKDSLKGVGVSSFFYFKCLSGIVVGASLLAVGILLSSSLCIGLGAGMATFAVGFSLYGLFASNHALKGKDPSQALGSMMPLPV